MDKQMERVIGHVYAFYLRFLPPFFFSSLILSLSFVPPSLFFNEQRWSPHSSSEMDFCLVNSSHRHVSAVTFARLLTHFQFFPPAHLLFILVDYSFSCYPAFSMEAHYCQEIDKKKMNVINDKKVNYS